MDSLKQAILQRVSLKEGNIVKVDSFLNHQIDVDLMDKIGREFYNRFRNKNVTKIMTIESSGIAIAVMTAMYFKVPVVFLKKSESKNLDEDLYMAEVYSYTKGKAYQIMGSKQYINEDDRILIVDDFLAHGNATVAMVDIIKQAGAQAIGVGIVIEKAFQKGGKILEEMGLQVECLASIIAFEDGKPLFK